MEQQQKQQHVAAFGSCTVRDIPDCDSGIRVVPLLNQRLYWCASPGAPQPLLLRPGVFPPPGGAWHRHVQPQQQQPQCHCAAVEQPGGLPGPGSTAGGGTSSGRGSQQQLFPAAGRWALTATMFNLLGVDPPLDSLDVLLSSLGSSDCLQKWGWGCVPCSVGHASEYMRVAGCCPVVCTSQCSLPTSGC